MNKEDNLKKLVAGRRKDFEQQVPSPKVWEGIRNQLQESGAIGEKSLSTPETKRAGILPLFAKHKVWWAAASVLFIAGLGINVFWQLEKDTSVSDVKTINQEVITGLPSANEDTATEASSTEILERENSALQIAHIAPEKVLTATTNTETNTDSARDERLLTAQLDDPNSASNRIEGILQLSALPALSEQAIESVLQVANQDPNTNVRLAAFELLWQKLPDTQAEEMIQHVFIAQDDPSIQLELMIAMEYSNSLHLQQATTEKLSEITNDPLSLDFVKEQAYAVLMKNW